MTVPGPTPAVLVFGPISCQLPSMRYGEDVYAACLVNDPVPGQARASLIIDEQTYRDASWLLVGPDGRAHAIEGVGSPAPWTGPVPPDSFRTWLTAGVHAHALSPPRDLAPLALVRMDTERRELELLLVSQFVVNAFNVVRSQRLAFGGDEFAVDDVLKCATPHLGEHHREVADESFTYTKFERGIEIEQKLAIPDSWNGSTWELATSIFAALNAGRLGPFARELKDHFQQSTRHNQMFEVIHPQAQQGYISFLTSPDGSYIVKRKTFAEDTLRRKETVLSNIDLGGSTPLDYISEMFPGVAVRAMPTFERVRFDINVESLTSGHIYGLMIDEVRLVEDHATTLRQVEVEYLRSRRHQGLDRSLIVPGLHDLTGKLADLLCEWGVAATPTYFSKLSFLRHIVEPVKG